ncbi:MAG: DUF5615 family PIN-like protein [Candidatus Micrarchaeota archaeon]|nr:DUF5615 family PIN-like protein [Candidatus Micrarchaeota archaeon]
MKFVLDANVPRSTVSLFAKLNLTAVHVSDVGFSNASDTEILSYATRRKSVQ